jgi:hypothetical protein
MPAHEGEESYVHMAQCWENALDQSESALNYLRQIFPRQAWLMTETGSRAVDEAMSHIKDGIVDLHRAGRHVLGADQYESFMQERSERAVGMNIERGD